MSAVRTVRVAADVDVAAAARAARTLAQTCGLSGVEAQYVATAVSEVARNAVKYARGGEVELAPAQRGGRRGLRVTVRDGGPGIDDVGLALRDGQSTGGSLGLGLQGARRLMDDFAIQTGADGTVVTMARWEGGLLATPVPAACTIHPGQGGVPVAQPFRNGMLLGVAAGPRAADVARTWRTRPWHAPAQLAEGCRPALDPGERVGLAVASVSALDGRLAWLRAGAVGCVLLRGDSERSGEASAGEASAGEASAGEASAGGEASGRGRKASGRDRKASGRDRKASGRGRIALFPPPGQALGRAGGGALRAATVDVHRDDVLVIAAMSLPAPALAELAATGGYPGAPAFLTARFARGALEPRRPPEAWRPERREGY